LKQTKEKPEELSDSKCSNCGRLNDMCGVFLKSINLCDECASSVVEIIFDDKTVVEKEDIANLNINNLTEFQMRYLNDE